VRFSLGRSYSEKQASVADGRGPSTCLFPSAAQADAVAELLDSRSLSAVSIGCGEGFAEGMLEARGVKVTAVDLDTLADTARYATLRRYCKEIQRIRPDELFQVASPAASALCFFWGRTTPWREYLAAFPSVPLVIIAGDGSQSARGSEASDPPLTDPVASALVGADGWRLVSRGPVDAVHAQAELAVYERVGEDLQAAVNDGAVNRYVTEEAARELRVDGIVVGAAVNDGAVNRDVAEAAARELRVDGIVVGAAVAVSGDGSAAWAVRLMGGSGDASIPEGGHPREIPEGGGSNGGGDGGGGGGQREEPTACLLDRLSAGAHYGNIRSSGLYARGPEADPDRGHRGQAPLRDTTGEGALRRPTQVTHTDNHSASARVLMRGIGAAHISVRAKEIPPGSDAQGPRLELRPADGPLPVPFAEGGVPRLIPEGVPPWDASKGEHFLPLGHQVSMLSTMVSLFFFYLSPIIQFTPRAERKAEKQRQRRGAGSG